MVAMKVTKEYDRHFFEVQQQNENGKWYRLAQSDYIEGGNEKAMLQSVFGASRDRINWSRGLEGFLPSDLLRIGSLRLVRVHKRTQVFDLDVKKALRVTRVASKA